jgi:hypothetical protein
MVVPPADGFLVMSAADDETADVAAGHAEAADRAASRLDDLLGGGQRQPPERVADSGEPHQPLGGPVADSVVVTAVLSREEPIRDERCPIVRWLASASRFRYQRLDRTRWLDELPGVGRAYGIPRDYLKELVHYWRQWQKHSWSASGGPVCWLRLECQESRMCARVAVRAASSSASVIAWAIAA